MSSKISQHYIEKKTSQNLLGQEDYFLKIYFFFSVGSSQLQTISNQSTHMALAGLIHIAWRLRPYLHSIARLRLDLRTPVARSRFDLRPPNVPLVSGGAKF